MEEVSHDLSLSVLFQSYFGYVSFIPGLLFVRYLIEDRVRSSPYPFPEFSEDDRYYFMDNDINERMVFVDILTCYISVD